MQNLNSSQYQQLMTTLSNHLESSSSMATNDQDKPTTVETTSICHSILVTLTFTTKEIWIVDSGTTRHVCCTANAFINLRSAENTNVILPNHTQISVSLCGDVKLSPNLVLHDVLFVPQFKFNLLSVSSLTLGSQTNTSFFRDHFKIQENTTKMMIGKGDKVQGLYVLDIRNFHSYLNVFVFHV